MGSIPESVGVVGKCGEQPSPNGTLQKCLGRNSSLLPVSDLGLFHLGSTVRARFVW
jgi:hypothetical protein